MLVVSIIAGQGGHTYREKEHHGDVDGGH